MDQSHPLTGVMDFWDDVIDDMEATADEYREADWDVHELHPGDVTPLPAGPDGQGGFVDDRVGLDVLVPGNEFRELEAIVEDATFDEYDAYRAEKGGVVFVVVAMKADDAGVAVLFPIYYRVDQAGEMLPRVRDRGELRTFIRPLHDERRVVFSQQEPEPFYPVGE